MKKRRIKPGHKYRLCPENCPYRDRLAPVCGHCTKRIVEEMEAKRRELRSKET